ncbi:MAG: hypothetical protein LRY68_00235 [Sulfurospirillum sp.]|nr:hypothetical protein [Sulfurospirillum sp.]
MQEEKNYHALSFQLEKNLKSSLFDQDFAIEMVSKHLIKMPFFHSKIRALLTFMGGNRMLDLREIVCDNDV